MDPKQLRKIIKEELEPVKEEIAFVKKDLGSVKEELGSVKENLGTVINDVGTVKEELGTVIKTQKEHTEKIDALTEEMFTVHQLAGTTLDVVKGRYEKNEQALFASLK